VNKYEKHKGIIKFNVGEDEFQMRPSVDDWVELFKVYDGKNEAEMKKSGFSKEEMDKLVNIMANSIKKCDPGTPVELIKEFVAGNFMTCMTAFGQMNKNQGMNQEMKKRIKNFEQKNPEHKR